MKNSNGRFNSKRVCFFSNSFWEETKTYGTESVSRLKSLPLPSIVDNNEHQLTIENNEMFFKKPEDELVRGLEAELKNNNILK